MSPSSSMSAAWTAITPLAEVVISCVVKFSAPSFSCQAIVPSYFDVETTSMSPSPSMSAASTELAPMAEVVMVCVVKFPAPSFSYQAIVS